MKKKINLEKNIAISHNVNIKHLCTQHAINNRNAGSKEAKGNCRIYRHSTARALNEYIFIHLFFPLVVAKIQFTLELLTRVSLLLFGNANELYFVNAKHSKNSCALLHRHIHIHTQHTKRDREKECDSSLLVVLYLAVLLP